MIAALNPADGDSVKRALLFLERLRREIAYDDVMGMSAQIAYYMVLSVIPFLIFVLSIMSRLEFGESLALSEDGDTALIGAPRADGIGSAYVFVRNGVLWRELVDFGRFRFAMLGFS